MRIINKKLYILFFFLALLSLFLKTLNKQEEFSEEDYYSNKKEKKEQAKETEEINYKDYLKRKEVTLNYIYNLFEHEEIQEFQETDETEIKNEPIAETTLVKDNTEIKEDIIDEKTLIKGEIDKIIFSGFVDRIYKKNLYLIYEDTPLELKNGEVMKIYIENKPVNIYVSYDSTNRLLIFYEPIFEIEIKREL